MGRFPFQIREGNFFVSSRGGRHVVFDRDGFEFRPLHITVIYGVGWETPGIIDVW